MIGSLYDVIKKTAIVATEGKVSEPAYSTLGPTIL